MQAPPAYKSTVMSLFLLTTMGGNLLVSVITAVNVLSGVWQFVFFALLQFGLAGLFMWAAAGYQLRDFSSHSQGGQEVQMKQRQSDAGQDALLGR